MLLFDKVHISFLVVMFSFFFVLSVNGPCGRKRKGREDEGDSNR